MYGEFKDHPAAELKKIDELGLTKRERILTTPQGVEIRTESGARVLDFCANNDLGLCNEPRVMANARVFRKGMEEAGFRIIPGVHPIVPVCRSRIRVQISAAHTNEQIGFALEKLKKVD